MEQQSQSKFWKPAAFGGILLSAVGLYDPAKDLYLKIFDPDYKGVVSVTLAEQQLRLADQNAECFLNMKRSKAQLNENLSISYGACANNNIHIGVYPKNRPAYQRWIEPNREQDMARLSGFFPAAYAGGVEPIASPVTGSGGFTLAQVELKTVCQEFQSSDKRKVIRITDEGGGQCYFERVNLLTGVVEVREKAPCNAKCSAESAKYR
jgi:hypothetical protein